jgi:prepilin-type N-terminal cleavage/methylation domain-containing protein
MKMLQQSHICDKPYPGFIDLGFSLETCSDQKHVQSVRQRLYRSKLNRRKCSGFTLIEIAIVLMIMGLMLGGIFKAEGVTEISTVHQLESDFRNIALYINEYQGAFHALPGDDPSIGSANSHLANAVSCGASIVGKCMTGNGIIDGRWNDNTAASESFLVWQQLRLAGYVSGETDITSANYPAKNIVGGILGVTNQAASPIVELKGNYIICSDGIAGKFVKQIDIALDDGNTASGSMMASIHGTAIDGSVIATNSIVDNELYLVCIGV